MHQFFADAWGAPAFMKTNNSDINGGMLCGVPGATCATGDWRQAYANYLVQYAQDYRADGIRLGYLGFENEANLAPGYSGMVLSPAQTANFAGVVGPALARSGLATQLECCAGRRLGLRRAVRPRHRERPAGQSLRPAVHQPRLHGPAGVPAARLDQAGVADRVVNVPEMGSGLGRRHDRIGAQLGPEHLHRAGPGRPQRVPVLVGQHHAG